VDCLSLLVIADLHIIRLGFFKIRFTTFVFLDIVTVMYIVTHVVVVVVAKRLTYYLYYGDININSSNV